MNLSLLQVQLSKHVSMGTSPVIRTSFASNKPKLPTALHRTAKRKVCHFPYSDSENTSGLSQNFNLRPNVISILLILGHETFAVTQLHTKFKCYNQDGTMKIIKLFV